MSGRNLEMSRNSRNVSREKEGRTARAIKEEEYHTDTETSYYIRSIDTLYSLSTPTLWSLAARKGIQVVFSIFVLTLM
jgi:hypothetical protein